MQKITKYLGVAACCLMLGSTASAEEWKMSAPLPESNFLTQNVRSFVDDVNAKAGDSLSIDLRVGGELIGSQETKQSVRTGQIPIAHMYVYAYGNENPAYETSTLPFIAGDYDRAKKMWEITKPHLDDVLGRQGIKILFAVPWPVQGFYTNEPIKTEADLDGVKFRVYSTKTARMAELLGADPVQVKFSEIPQAFATGLVSAMYTSPQTGLSTQAWDFAKYFTRTSGGNLSMTAVVVNQAAFDGLSDDVKKIIETAAATALARGWKSSESLSKEHITALEAKGMVILDPAAVLQKKLDAVGQEILKEWAATAGDLGTAVLAKFGNKN